MSFFNKVILIGRLTRDPEIRMSNNGSSICKFSLAISRRIKYQDGSSREEITFVDIDSFGKQAETISKFFSKGKPILVEGRLKLDQWESQTGEKRSKLSVILETFSFINSRSEQESISNNHNTDNKHLKTHSQNLENLDKNQWDQKNNHNQENFEEEDVPF